jgi:hypothetical protein
LPLSTADLKVLLAAQKQDALSGQEASILATERTDALDYYLGDMSKDMPTIEGRSKAVSTDVADTIEGMMPSMMEIFCGGDEVVKFAAVGEEDVPKAEQETDYVNHVFMQKNPGFLILYSFIKDALLSKNGIVKGYVEEGEKEEEKTFYDQPDDAYGIILAEPNIEVTAHTEKDDGAGGKLHDVTVVCKTPYKKTIIEPVPPEEFGIARNAKSIRTASYYFHEVKKAQADLIADGYDAEQIKKLPTYASVARMEESARDTVGETTEKSTGDENLNKAMRLIRVTEHYVRMDYEQDGKVRLYRVTTGGEQGDVLLRDGKPDVMKEDLPRFAAMTPIIMTHRFFGRSIADLIMDIQRIKTAMIRAVLDNAYIANNPRAVVSEEDANESTLDDLLVSRPGGVVRVKRNAVSAVAWQSVPTIGNHVFPLIEYQDMVKEQRTGVGRQTQGIDADALQNQSATAVSQLFSAAQARIRLIARIFAETGIKDLFWMLHGLLRTHGNKNETVKLRNQWVTVNPQEWKSRDDLEVHVGLGHGGKSQQMAMMMAVIGLQEKAFAAGMTEVVQPKNFFNSAKQVTRICELKNTTDFFTDPSSPEGQQAEQNKPPNPKMLEIQAKQQGDEKKMQMDAALQQRADERKAQIEQVQAQADIATNQQKLQAEMAAQEREYQLKERLAIIEAQLEREKMEREEARKDREHEAKLQAMREGHYQKSEFAAQSHEMSMAERQAASEQRAE